MTRFILLSLALVMLLPTASAEELSELRPAGVSVQRYALIIGANDGGLERIRLKFAVTDAEAFARVLTEMGGVPPEHAIVVREPDVNGVYEGLSRLEALLSTTRDANTRVEVVVYYSGHSDEQGLLLGGELLGYKALREAIDALSADVRIVVLDSCASGALTQTKGGMRSAPFLMDTATKVEGHAFLTSSSADETAQESERLGGSFFTHYLVTGLRGAADVTGDERVTLGEAYQFAFHETLKRTESTMSGPQHPAFDIQLTGSGDLILTDLRKTGSTLVLEQELQGRISLRDDKGALVAELYKVSGRAAHIGLEPGDYTITVLHEDSREGYTAELVLKDGERLPLSDATMERIALEVTTARGGELPPRDVEPEQLPFAYAVLPDLVTNVPSERPITANFSFNLLAGYGHNVNGMELGLGLNMLRGDLNGMQVGLAGNIVEGEVSGMQLGVGTNIAAEGMNGMQLTAGYNQAGDGLGLQLSGGANVAQSFEGLQFAAGYNHADVLDGLQISGGANYADTLDGVQVAVVNIGGHVQGSQIGLVNIAGRVDGMQLGLVNVAEESDVTVGPFNFVEDGYTHVAFWASELAVVNIGLKLGGEYFYTFLMGGFSPEELTGEEGMRYLAEVGFGVHIPTSIPLFVDIELAGGALFADAFLDRPGFLGSLRATVGWSFYEHLSLFAGASINTMWNDLEKTHDLQFAPLEVRVYELDYNLQIWPGFFAGVQF